MIAIPDIRILSLAETDKALVFVDGQTSVKGKSTIPDDIHKFSGKPRAASRCPNINGEK